MLDSKKDLSAARELMKSSPVYDMLYVIGVHGAIPEISMFEEAGFTAVSITAAADDDAWPPTIVKKLAEWRRIFSKYPNRYILIDRVDDLLRAKAEGKLGIFFNFQGTEAIGRNLAMVGVYERLGVKSMLMAYNRQNSIGMGCIEAQKHDYGLSEFGREWVAEMNANGVIVDCSHSGYRTTMDAIELSTKPCIFSHSNAAALYAHPRNIRDDQIKACAEKNGVICVNGVGSFNGDIHEVRPETVFRHLDYVVNLVGPSHVGLGLDYMTPEFCDQVLQKYAGDLSRVGMSEPPWKFLHPSQTVEVVQLMIDHGYPLSTIRGILGENVGRVFREVW